MARTKKPTAAVQLFTLRDYLKTPKEMKRTFGRLAKQGWKAAQISGVGPIDPAELNAMMTGEGIEPIGAHVGLGEFETDLAAVAAKCKAWGVAYVAIPWMSADTVKTAAGWKKMGRLFSAYGKELAKEGLTVQYHNHAFEFQKFGVKAGRGGETGLGILYDNSDPEHLQAELDFGWVARGGEQPVAWAKRMAGRLDQVHLKDWGIVNDAPAWRALGEGGVDWPAVIRAARQSGCTCLIVEQDSCPVTGNPFKSLQISLDYLKSLKLA